MKYHLRNLTNKIERLKICWYVLTKKHYAFYAFDRMEIGNSGGRCFIESRTEESFFFLTCIINYTKELRNKLNKENTEIKNDNDSLKAEDLMIGDWVRYNDNPFCFAKVKSITNNPKDMIHVGNLLLEIKDVHPILITPILLEKNGFHYLEEKHCFFNLKIDLHPMRYGKYAPYRVGNMVMFIEYVHELQHALRLCKVDKDIEI